MIEYNLPFLPPNKNVETLPILKQAAKAHRYLAEQRLSLMSKFSSIH